MVAYKKINADLQLLAIDTTSERHDAVIKPTRS